MLNSAEVIYITLAAGIGNACQALHTCNQIEMQRRHNLNNMPTLAFTRDAVHDLFLLYASQIFKAILPSQLKYCVTVLEIIPGISF